MHHSVPRHILSFGGGVNSVALLLWLLREGHPLDEVVFADTGGEVPETYAYVTRISAYLQEKDIPFTLIQGRVRGRDLYDTCLHRRVFPSTIWRWSTRDFKVLPIHRYYRSLSDHVNQYLAIAYDELERMKDSHVPFITHIYPLVDNRFTRENCKQIILDFGWPLPPKSSCFFCPFNTLSRWKWIYENHPDLYARALALEENSKHFPSQRLTDQVFRARASVTLRELPKLFDETAVDDSQVEIYPCGAECMT
jgi:Phosphoadenosine phosphosulfate reductase family